MNYKGTIIKESLKDTSILEEVKILDTKIEKVTEKHKTPWLKQWTIISIEVNADKAAKISKRLSECMESSHDFYADFKNENIHFIIFKNKIFRVDITSKSQYDEVKKYALSLGLPEYQVDFHPDIKNWER
jgi:hypothetical protein